MQIQLTPWRDALYDEGIGKAALENLISRGLFPQPIVILTGKRGSQKYFPANELEARRACLVAHEGNEDELRELLARIQLERGERARRALALILKNEVAA